MQSLPGAQPPSWTRSASRPVPVATAGEVMAIHLTPALPHAHGGFFSCFFWGAGDFTMEVVRGVVRHIARRRHGRKQSGGHSNRRSVGRSESMESRPPARHHHGCGERRAPPFPLLRDPHCPRSSQPPHPLPSSPRRFIEGTEKLTKSSRACHLPASDRRSWRSTLSLECLIHTGVCHNSTQAFRGCGSLRTGIIAEGLTDCGV